MGVKLCLFVCSWRLTFHWPFSRLFCSKIKMALQVESSPRAQIISHSRGRIAIFCWGNDYVVNILTPLTGKFLLFPRGYGHCSVFILNYCVFLWCENEEIDMPGNANFKSVSFWMTHNLEIKDPAGSNYYVDLFLPLAAVMLWFTLFT